MKKLSILLITVMCLISGELCLAEHSESDIWNRDTLTDGFWGVNDQLADSGIELGLGVTNIYQQNVRGGLRKHRRAGRFSGSYDLELTVDMQKLLGFEGGSLYVHGEGWWSKSGGIDGPSVGSVFGVNGDAGSRDAIVVTEFWWEQAMFEDTLHLRLGKLDITGGFDCRGCPVSFDGSAFANDESAQFLNSALVNNPTIPFPDYGLGAVLYWNPVDWWYASVGVADAQADGRETGFNTAFHSEDYFFYIFETGITPQLDSANGPLQGAYRAGLWYDPQDKTHLSSGKNVRDDIGFYLNFDQMLCKENTDPESSQGLGVFGRFGYADSKVNEVTNFWSVGLQYQGLFEGRDDDVLGVGFAHGAFNDKATDFSEDYENILEVYYNTQVTPWLSLSPSIQYIANPGGAKGISDAVVLGLRVQMEF